MSWCHGCMGLNIFPYLSHMWCIAFMQWIINKWNTLEPWQELKVLRWCMSSLCGQMHIMYCTNVEGWLYAFYTQLLKSLSPSVCYILLSYFILFETSFSPFKGKVREQLFRVRFSWGWDVHTHKGRGWSLHCIAHLPPQRVQSISSSFPPCITHANSQTK